MKVTTFTSSPVGARRLLAKIVLRPLENSSPVGSFLGISIPVEELFPVLWEILLQPIPVLWRGLRLSIIHFATSTTTTSINVASHDVTTTARYCNMFQC